MEKKLDKIKQLLEVGGVNLDTPVNINADNSNPGLTVTNTGAAASFSTSGNDTTLTLSNSDENLAISTDSPIQASGCLKDGQEPEAFLYVKNVDSGSANPGNKVKWAAFFESNSNSHSSLFVNNTGTNRGATVFNSSSEHSTLVLENQKADGQGYRAATLTNNSSTQSTLYLTNNNSGPAIEVSKGGVNMMGSPTATLDDGTYTANTDGFVIGTITPPDKCDVRSMLWLIASSGDLTVTATGGNNLGPNCSFSNYGNLILPVQSGKEFSISADQGRYNEKNSSYAFYFIPMGTCDNPCTKKSSNISSSHLAKSQINIARTDNAERVNNMIDALEVCFDKKLEGNKRTTLEKAFKNLLL
ncbi:hypothetical protein [Marinomonas posidonica]|uniref:Uncharacterized protein n=1 Tax=Marinomonas posidonica (strain CECT 7376 / NCIMB 14433 / IVIA-Po-181) TaxID=491952 RepID=F6CWK9_MARPP|nr:hypothetical protein [Marinomonas posidonica]AEF54359.1 hypothetical protein Mar181_1312 [Marinomonas posidonica IVIA-Po-181]